MGTPVIGAILVLLELQPGGRGTDRDAVQQPPERLIVKFREVADCVLQGSRGRSLGTAHPGGDDLIYAIAGLHAVAAGGGVLLIWGNFHVGGKAHCSGPDQIPTSRGRTSIRPHHRHAIPNTPATMGPKWSTGPRFSPAGLGPGRV